MLLESSDFLSPDILKLSLESSISYNFHDSNMMFMLFRNEIGIFYSF